VAGGLDIMYAMLNRREFVLTSAAASAGPLAFSASSPSGAPLLASVRLGAEFFLNATETRESVFGHFRAMRDTGLTVARIFTLWDQVERERGKWDFTRYDWVYDAAAENGILIANTLCSEDPPGWLGGAPFYHAWRDLSNPKLRPYSEIYLEKVVSRYKIHPAHGVWLLQNEPGINDTAEPYVLEAYARWLEKKYGAVENLNRLWYTPLARFADVKPPVAPREAGWPDYPSNLDWLRFRSDHLADQLRWLHAQVDKYHPGALTHINPPGLTGNMPASGRDLWRLKPTAHFLGTSMHAAWHFTMFARDDFGAAYAYCCDLTRSASAPAPWWVTEMQAGPTIFTGNRPLNPTGGEITRWLWDAVGNGARGVVFWLWHPRTEGNEAGEWALAGPGGEPTARTRATRAVATALRQHEHFFAAAKPQAARTAILYDRDAMLLYAVDGWRRPSNEIIHSLMGCYQALHRAHVPVDFLDTSELDEGQAGRYRVLYLPYCYALSAKSSAAIREFVRNGGTVWADGLVAWKDEQGITRQLPPGPLSDVFGFTVEDIDAAWDPFAFAGRNDTAGELWRCVIPAGKGTVLLQAPDGRPAAVEHSFGRGRAIYYGTALTLAELRRGDARMEEWIAQPAVEASRDLAVRLAEGPARLAFRALEAPGKFAAVLNNWGPAGRAKVRFPSAVRSVTEILSAKSLALEIAGPVCEVALTLEEGASAVLLADVAR
jgi:beta-galactosidase